MTQIINPITRRKIKINGHIFNKLIKDGHIKCDSDHGYVFHDLTLNQDYLLIYID